MLGIVDRYIFREVVKVFAAIVVVLLLIMASILFLRSLEEVNVGGLGVDVVFRYLRLEIQRDTASLLPPAFFLAMLATLSRFSSDSELIAMNACGIGPPNLYRILLILAIPVGAFTAWFALYLQPAAAAGIQEIRLQQREQAAQIAGLQPGRFYVEQQGNVVVYVGEIDRRKSLANVFILDRREDTARLVVSDGGRHQIEDATGDHIVTLSSGHRFDGNPGSGSYLIGEFRDYKIRIPGSGPTTRQISKRATLPTAELWHSDDIGNRVELQHRLAAPLSIITLTLLAIPLVDISPRQRATGRVVLAFLAYICYFNLERLAESWMETGVTPPWMGTLWYQVFILGAVYLVLMPESFWLKRVSYRLRGSRRVVAADEAG